MIVAKDLELRTVGLPYGHGLDLDDAVLGEKDADLDRPTENKFRADLLIDACDQYVTEPGLFHFSGKWDEVNLRDSTSADNMTSQAYAGELPPSTLDNKPATVQ